MFTGIIESLGTVVALQGEQNNLHITVQSNISRELKIDQSLAHNGVCLTVIDLEKDTHTVIAIAETLNKTNLDKLQIGSTINLERAMLASARFDGHIVQGHVDTVAQCTHIQEQSGSWNYHFQFSPENHFIVVPKGSICVNGVSLTVVEASTNSFSVAIIPYTYENTTFHQFKVGSEVNLEFDIVGKYMAELYRRNS